jgi:hypothetical protein
LRRVVFGPKGKVVITQVLHDVECVVGVGFSVKVKVEVGGSVEGGAVLTDVEGNLE